MRNILLPALILIAICVKADAQMLIGSDSVPVRVSYFNVEQSNNKVLLNWKVVCYLRFADFEVQRSSNGTDFTTINSFTADRIRCLSPFNLDDKTSSGRVYYRLRVGDKDGNFSTSKVLVAFGGEKSFEVNSLTPNLVVSNAILSISSAENDMADISIVNMLGNTVKRIQANLTKGTTDVKLDVSALSKGIYVIRVTSSFAGYKVVKMIKS
jgi:hypothetical protein